VSSLSKSYLTLVGPIVSLLDVFYLQSPVVGALGVQHLEPLVVCVGEHARSQYVPVSTPHPRYLEHRRTKTFRKRTIKQKPNSYFLLDVYIRRAMSQLKLTEEANKDSIGAENRIFCCIFLSFWFPLVNIKMISQLRRYFSSFWEFYQ